MISFLLILPLLLFFAFGIWHESRRIRAGKRPGLFQHFLQNTRAAFSGKMLALQGVAVLATLPLVLLGPDQIIQDTLQRADLFDRSFLWFMLMIGNIWHLAPAILLWGYAAWRNKKRLRLAAFAALQALFINVGVNTILKLLTGRRGPANPYRTAIRMAPFPKTDNPADFDFAFWNRALQDGRFFWPSGHTASIFAVVTALVIFYPEKKWILLLGYPLAFFTALLMVAGDFHWFSDVVAGAIGGSVIGFVCGRYFRSLYAPSKSE